jgi:hypothetical protein
MIYRDITVKYYTNKNGLLTVNQGEAWKDMPKDDWDFVDSHIAKFHMFKNNGRVSKRDRTENEIIDREAERLLQKQLEVESEAKEDHERAVELAKIVNAADFKHATDWTEIKSKTSHSGWYETWQGELNVPSIYIYEVPASVEKEARELFDIRHKHQGDSNFKFYDCGMTYRIIREADHPNIDHEEPIESWIEPAEQVLFG